MGILSWIIIGLFAGVVAAIITRSRENMVFDIITGILGAFVGGLFVNLYGYTAVNGVSIYGALLAALGAFAVLLVGKRLA